MYGRENYFELSGETSIESLILEYRAKINLTDNRVDPNPNAPTFADVSQAPIDIQLSAAPVAENATGAVVGQLAVTDLDHGDTHSFAVSDDRFEVIEGILKLKEGESLDYEAGATVTVDVTATDSGDVSLTQSFDVVVTDLNDGVTSVKLLSAVLENAAGAVVGRVIVADPDTSDNHSFVVSDDRFLVTDGLLRLRAGVALDYESDATIPVEVTATDDDGLSLTQRFEIAVVNVNEGISAVSLTAAPVLENAAGAVVGQLAVTDIDGADTHFFTVSDKRFEVVGGVLKLKAGSSLDFEADHSVTLAVTARDAGGLALTRKFTFYVEDIAEGILPKFGDVMLGSRASDALQGANGNDVLIGNGGGDILGGGKGRDLVAGGAGADALSGGRGFDTLDYSGSSKGVFVDLQKGFGKGGEARGDKFSSFEGVIGSGASDILLGSKAAMCSSVGKGPTSLLVAAA